MIVTGNDWGDPNGIETHSLDVIKFGFETFKGSATVVPKVAAGIASSVAATASDTIGQGEINVARLPCCCICSESKRQETGGADSDELDDSHVGRANEET